jgi:ATP-dependent DNA helicase RecG
MDLNTSVKALPLVGPIYVRRLEKLDITTIGDLLNHVPHRYLDYSLISEIGQAQVGETVTIRGQVVSIKNQYTKSGKKIQFGQVSDGTGTIDTIWFNQPFLVRNIRPGVDISLAGKIDWFGKKRALISPEYEKIAPRKKGIHTGRLVPIYHETAKISSKWLRGRIAFVYPLVNRLFEEFLPVSVLKEFDLVNFRAAIEGVHFPKDIKSAGSARKRLAFNELLFLQLKNVYRKINWQKNEPISKLKVNNVEVTEFLNSLPFKLTKSQERSVKEILKDLGKETPMNRLLEGDVGSGKTVVAAAAAFVAFANGYQSVFMAPTQILAQQHFSTLREVFKTFKVRVSLITSEGVKRDTGKTDVFVGTHALIHRRIEFDNVALVVIDEQHRFGVVQRAHLITQSGKKKRAPHVLTMTATPIPRTIALTIYGDLELSTLDELPGGRKPITTWVVPPEKREGAYNWIQKQIKETGVQAFVICPLIEESEKETMKQVKAATAEYEKLCKLLPDLNLGLLHGRLKPKEKDNIMEKFKKRKVDILVSTPVVEVGIDVPNATIMVIEAAERFGLAQLHQLRGRVGRGKKKSYCLLFTAIKSKKAFRRLEALKKMVSGFELAELDLKMRGPGEMFGTKQHGFQELKVASWQDTELIKSARQVANEAVENPKKYSKLLNKLKKEQVAPN